MTHSCVQWQGLSWTVLLLPRGTWWSLCGSPCYSLIVRPPLRTWALVHWGLWKPAIQDAASSCPPLCVSEHHLRPVQGTSHPQVPILMGTRKGGVALPPPWGSKSFSQPWATPPGPDLAHPEATVWNSCSPQPWLHRPAPPK